MGGCSSSGAGSYGYATYKVNPTLAAAALRVTNQLCRDRLELSLCAPDIKEFTIFQTVEESDIEDIMRLAIQDTRCKRAMGSMVGMAVADSVGGLFEFLPVGKKGSHFDAKTLQATGVYNKFALKPGQWTDDTSMGLCLADSLLVCGGYDGSDIRLRFWNWWNRGYNNTFRLDEERSASVGLGGNVSLSLLVMTQSRDQDLKPRFEGLGDDAGNGSVMRLAPVPIYFHSDLDLAIRASAESSYTTHPGPSAADACAFLGFLICRAIRRDSRRMTAAQFLDDAAAAYLARPEVESQPSLQKLLRSDERIGSKERCWNWRDPKGPYLLETIAARGKHYNGYPVQKDYFGSYSMDGLAIALHSVYHTRSFMDAVVRCINFLGDADSTGAICGQIAGAFYGVDTIDVRLVSQLRRWDAGQIALRGALLYVLGSELSEEEKDIAKLKTWGALAWDRNRPMPDGLVEVAAALAEKSALPAAAAKPPVLPKEMESPSCPPPIPSTAPLLLHRENSAEPRV
eukprot:CAMPEP_0115315788 /NCGR_PEP_ID=MMETSP0270-20121206/77773_1 /TAXON_ID=71861 /ORGANISM="Scrippsiella trochoidea, Strain CCMP3099" /LENGTH=512 /DNA_ID=CAMNT_0002735145 /DNA_START=61 /DNA_END=1596 /DNA_ORIENTATION=-